MKIILCLCLCFMYVNADYQPIDFDETASAPDANKAGLNWNKQDFVREPYLNGSSFDDLFGNEPGKAKQFTGPRNYNTGHGSFALYPQAYATGKTTTVTTDNINFKPDVSAFGTANMFWPVVNGDFELKTYANSPWDQKTNEANPRECSVETNGTSCGNQGAVCVGLANADGSVPPGLFDGTDTRPFDLIRNTALRTAIETVYKGFGGLYNTDIAGSHGFASIPIDSNYPRGAGVVGFCFGSNRAPKACDPNNDCTEGYNLENDCYYNLGTCVNGACDSVSFLAPDGSCPETCQQGNGPTKLPLCRTLPNGNSITVCTSIEAQQNFCDNDAQNIQLGVCDDCNDPAIGCAGCNDPSTAVLMTTSTSLMVAGVIAGIVLVAIVSFVRIRKNKRQQQENIEQQQSIELA